MASIREQKRGKGTSYTVLYDWKDKTGKRRQKSGGTFTDRRKAEALKHEIDMKKRRNQFISPSQLSVEAFINEWLPVRAKLKGWAPSYYSLNKYLLKKHIYSEIGHLLLQDVTPMHIESMFAMLQAKRCEERKGPQSKMDNDNSKDKEQEKIKPSSFLSGSTLASIFILTKSFFNAAVQRKLIQENPVMIDKPKINDREERNIWDLNQMITALEHIEHDQLHLMVHMAAAHTYRIGEICGFTWDHIDLTKGIAKVNATMQRVDKESLDELPRTAMFQVFPNQVNGSKSILILKAPKNKESIRYTKLTLPIVKELQRRKQLVDNNKLRYGKEYNDYNLIFCHDNGLPVEPNLVEKWLDKWCKRVGTNLGLPKIQMHGLRHSSTTLLLYLSNGDLKTVQSYTGHGSAKMILDVYSHPIMEHQAQLVEKLETVLYDAELPSQDKYSPNILFEPSSNCKK